jgi:hypothetical protein
MRESMTEKSPEFVVANCAKGRRSLLERLLAVAAEKSAPSTTDDEVGGLVCAPHEQLRELERKFAK